MAGQGMHAPVRPEWYSDPEEIEQPSRQRCARCAAPQAAGQLGCRSCEVAESLAAELKVPVEEMLAIARAHWL